MAVIRGSAANNNLHGTTGNDTLYGNNGNDRLIGQGGSDRIYGGAGVDTLRGSAGNDTLQGGTGNDWIYGDAGNDTIVGEGNDDHVFGGAGNDRIIGSAGNDTVYGDAGNDTLLGGAGRDFLYGGAGDDLLNGGAGADMFILGNGTDRINDWNRSEGDVVDLRAALGNYNPATDDLSDFVRVLRTPGANTTTIAIDANGMDDGRANFQNVGVVLNSTYHTLDEMRSAGGLLVPGGGSGASGSTGSPRIPATASASGAPYQNADGSSEHFMEFLGVNIQIYPGHPSYGNARDIISAMNYLGIDNVRVNVESPIDNRTTAPIYDTLANAGFDFAFRMRREHVDDGEGLIGRYAQFYKSFQSAHPGSIKAIEGVNEVGYPEWNMSKPAAAEYQRDLYRIMDAEGALRNIPIYNLTVWRGDDRSNFSSVGDLAGFSDSSNAHAYFLSFLEPYYEMPARLNNAKLIGPDNSVVITEAGYPSIPIPGNSLAVNETAQAKQILNVMMDAYAHGVDSIYLYELFNSRSHDPTNNQANFGLFDHGGSAKASARAIHNFTTIIDKNTGTSGRDPVGYDLRNEDSNTHSVALSKNGGVTDLVVWREETIWDFRNMREIGVAPDNVQVVFDETVDSVNVYDPMRGTQSVQHFANVDSIDLQVTDHPLIVEIFS